MRSTAFILCLFSLLIFFIYSKTAPPSVYHGDSGETITASYTLGIQHPPGYPLFSLIGRLAVMLPLGDASYRIYLLSSLLSIACFITIFFLSRRAQQAIGLKDQGDLINALFAASFCTGAIIWEQSVTAKGGIYMLNALFSASIFLLALKSPSARGTADKYLLLASFLYGLSFGNHHMTQAVMFPAYAAVFLAVKGRDILRPKNILYCGAFFLAGFSIYLYLPIRALSGAVINWGDPSSLENFLQVFSRYQYIRAEGARSLSGAFSQAAYYISSVASENYFTLAFVIAGLAAALKQNKKAALFISSAFLLFLLVTSLYLNLKTERLYIMQTYIVPVFITTAVLASFSASFFTGKAPRLLLVLLLSCLLTASAATAWKKNDKSRYYYSRDYINNMLMLADANSIIFTTGDGIVFPSWYSRYVKRLRPDVTVIGSPVLPMKWVRDQITQQNPGVMVPRITEKKIGTESTGYIINAIIRMNLAKYPVYFSYNKPEENALNGGLALMPKGILFRVVPEQYAVLHQPYLATQEITGDIMNYRGIIGDYDKPFDNGTLKLYVKDYAISRNAAGVFFEEKNRNDLALKYFTEAHKMAPDDHEFLYNMGNAYFNLNDQDTALLMYKKSLEIKPDYESAIYNTGVVYYKKGLYQEALRSFIRLKELNPSRTDLDPMINTLMRYPGTIPVK